MSLDKHFGSFHHYGHCRKEPFEDEEDWMLMYGIIDHFPDGGGNKGARE